VSIVVRDVQKCKEFAAGDDSLLRELFHAHKGDFSFHYSLAHAVVAPGKRTKRHQIRFSEVYYVLEGWGMMHVGHEIKKVYPGCAAYIPPFAQQYIENIGKVDLKFLCIVDPAWKPEAEKIL